MRGGNFGRRHPCRGRPPPIANLRTGMESSAVFGVGCAGQAADDATDREALEQQRRKLEHFATRAGSGHSAGPRDHTDVTPHTLAPEDYSQALSCEPGLYTIGVFTAACVLLAHAPEAQHAPPPGAAASRLTVTACEGVTVSRTTVPCIPNTLSSPAACQG